MADMTEKRPAPSIVVTTVAWRLGDPYPGTNGRPMTFLGSTQEFIPMRPHWSAIKGGA